MTKKLDYKSSGVNYDLLDPFKIAAQQAAGQTDGNIDYLNIKEVSSTRGESGFLIETDTGYIAHTEETLGTKNLIADAMLPLTGKSYYDNIAIDTIGTIVNDIISVGALPISLAMHLAVGKSEWFENKQRMQDLINGWKKGCDLSSAVWAGGETPTLKGIIEKNTVLLSGSAVGIIQDKKFKISADNLQDGDRIILLESSGIHANGASLARKIATETEDGYKAKLSDDRIFGEALLDPTVIYVPILRDCIKANINLHYITHITGHGLRKIMRAPQPYHYIIEKLLPAHPVFDYIQKKANLETREMYSTFNMGIGFTLYVDPKDSQQVLKICSQNNIKAIDAGYIQKEGNNKNLSLKPLALEFSGESLAVR